MLKRETKNSCVKSCPQLCQDLQDKNLDTLNDYHVPWKDVDMTNNQPTTEVDKYIFGEMCVQAAKGVELQCKREYWQDTTDGTRATQLHKLSSSQRKNLPTNNLNTERYLAKFGYLASQSAQHSNRFFKAKRIRDDLMFNQTDTVQESLSSSAVHKSLDTICYCAAQPLSS